MSVIPTISITAERFSDDEAEEATESTGLNINDAHTDVEDLDSDKETRKSNTSKRKSLSLGVKKTKCEALTDVEDMNTSGSDDNEDKVPVEDIQISLEEFLDQPYFDESTKYSGHKQHMSDQPRTKPTLNALAVEKIDEAILTDCENLNASDDDEESEREPEDDSKIIVLEEANTVASHDSVKIDPGHFSQSPIHLTTTGESTSSSTESPTEEKQLLRPGSKKGCNAKRNRAPVSDTENIMFSDEEVHKKKCNAKVMPLILDGWEEVTIELSDAEDDSVKTPMTPMFPEIDITFAEKAEEKKTKQKSSLLKVAEVDDGLTDVENLNSSDDEDEEPTKSKLIPSAIIKPKVGFLTDTEDIDEVESELDETPEVSLPTPTRELVEVREGQNRRQIIRPSCGESIGLTPGYIDKGLTDVEDLSDAEDIDDSASKYVIDLPPQLDVGSVHVSEKMSSHLKPDSTDLDPLTDTEELGPSSSTGRRKKHKHRCSGRGKQKNLDVKSNTNLRGTDVEELDMSDPEGFKEVRKPQKKGRTSIAVPVIVSADGAKTDVEYVSADDNPPEYNWQMSVDPNSLVQGDSCVSTVTQSSEGGEKKTAHHVPVIRRTSATVDGVCFPHTDVEDMGTVSDPENESYSRAQTATPFEVHQTLDDASSTIHDRTQNAFDVQTEKLNIKGHRDAPDVYTDVEYVDEEAKKE